MKTKILVVFAVLILVFTSINVIGEEFDNEISTQIAEKNDSILFSEASVEASGEYVTLDVEGTNTILSSAGKPMLPIFTTTYKFPAGTKIKEIICTPINVKTTTIDGKIRPAPKPLPVTSIKNTQNQNGNDEETTQDNEIITQDEDIYSSSELYPNSWFKYKICRGLYDDQDTILVKIDCYPVRYSPASDTIHASESFDIKITYDEGQTIQSNEDTYDLLIITPKRFYLAVLPLVLHKQRNGVTTLVKTVD